MLEQKIVDLKRELVEYAGLVEGMIDKSMKGLFSKDVQALKSVIESDESKANHLEIEIDEIGASVIAQFQPKAKSLRTILMILKMNNDLERLGDHAVNIAQSALFLIDRPAVKPYVDLPKMFEGTIKMLKDSVTSFINEDAELAKEVCERDDKIDNLKKEIFKELAGYMSKDVSTIERALNIIWISSNLERIADLSTNICEEVIYLAEGRVIKHHHEEENKVISDSHYSH